MKGKRDNDQAHRHIWLHVTYLLCQYIAPTIDLFLLECTKPIEIEIILVEDCRKTFSGSF